MDTFKRISKAKEEHEKIYAIIGKLRYGMEFPYTLMISDCGIPYSIYKTRNKEKINVSAKEWPSAQKIAEVMKELNEALEAYDDAYSKLNDIEKKGVKYMDI